MKHCSMKLITESKIRDQGTQWILKMHKNSEALVLVQKLNKPGSLKKETNASNFSFVYISLFPRKQSTQPVSINTI